MHQTTRQTRSSPRRSRGFSIIEAMLVLLIMSIIVILALPAYQDYATRSKVSDMLIVVAGLRNDIAEFYMINSEFPDSNDEAGMKPPGEYTNKGVQSITIDTGGQIIVESAVASLEGETIIYQPSWEGNKVVWDCTGGTMPARFRPPICRL